jgi:hypothetical protein
MSTTEALPSDHRKKMVRPASTSIKINEAEEKIHILPKKIHLFTLHAAKTYFADFRAGRLI